MNIASTLPQQTIKRERQSYPQVAQAPASQAKPATKPLTEQWVVGKETFASTSELLDKLGQQSDVQAIYRFSTSETQVPFSDTERVQNAIGYGLVGTTGGAALGGFLGLVLNSVESLNAYAGGPAGMPLKALVVPALVGAAIAGAGAAAYGVQVDANPKLQSITGTLDTSGAQALFTPQGQPEKQINLSEYQNAMTPELVDGTSAEVSDLRGALTGAALGAGSVLATLTGSPGLIIGGLAGGTVGASTNDRTMLSTGVGVAAGIAATAGIGAMALTGNSTGLLLATGAAAVGGALVGKQVLTARESTPASRDYGEQWWNKN